jgi:hypothetical protein
MYKFSENSINRIESLENQYLKKILYEAIKISPIDFGIPYLGGKRTAEQQFELFKKGRKRIKGRWTVINASKKVTNADGYQTKSYHQTGTAFDVVAYVGGKYTWDSYYMAMIAGTILSVAAKYQIALTWGGTFGKKGNILKGWDKGHYQIK